MNSAILKPFFWSGPLIRQLCETDPDFARYLIQQSGFERQCLVMSLLAWQSQSNKVVPLAKLGLLVRSQNKKSLLQSLLTPYPPGLVSVLGKLGNRVMAKGRYVELLDLMSEPNAAKVLRHLPRVRSATIMILGDLDPPYRTTLIVNHIGDEITVLSFRYAMAAAKKLSPASPDQSLVNSIEKVFKKLPKQANESYEVRSVISNWLSRRIQQSPLPEPPWVGSEYIRPITQAQEILKAAKSFENCLASQIFKVINHQRYFYILQGRGRAIAALDNEPLLGWVLGEIQGPKNNKVPSRTREKIVREFKTAGIREFQGINDIDLYL